MTCRHPNKVAHKSRHEARQHIAALYASGKGNPDLAVYACDNGKHFHVGHDKKRLAKRVRRALKRGAA